MALQALALEDKGMLPPPAPGHPCERMTGAQGMRAGRGFARAVPFGRLRCVVDLLRR